MDNKKKKILIATGIYPPDIGGPANYVKILEKELPDKGFDVEVVTYSDSLEKEKNIYKISRKQNIFFRYSKYFWRVFKLIPKIDLVYVQGPVSEGLPTWLACRLRRQKYILKIVGDYAWEQGRQRFGVEDLLDEFQNKKYSFRVELMRKLQRMVAQGAEKIVVPSEYLKRIVVKGGIKPEKIIVIYNSIKKNPEIKNKESLKRELNIPGDLICSAGRLVPWKGFEALIDLMPELLKINQDFRLVIIGDGPDKKRLEEKIKILNLENKIILTNRLEQLRAWDYIRASDVFVLNTGYEGLSHFLIEAMMLEVPIVATQVGGNPELIKHQSSGFLVKLNQKEEIKAAILKLWQDKDLAKRFVKTAKQNALKKFQLEIMINKLIKVLCEF